MTDYFIIGQIYNQEINNEQIKEISEACKKNSSFSILEYRSIYNLCDTIICNCFCDEVPNQNKVGILNRERVAILYNPDQTPPYSVLMLRKDFPLTMHQNHVNDGSPCSICIYLEPWSSIEREWTPEKFIKRITWWLTETSRANLHKADQPLEEMYFESPFSIILPHDFEHVIQDKKKHLVITNKIGITGEKKITIRSKFLSKSERNFSFICIVITPVPIVHGIIEKFPQNLGQLNTQFNNHGSDIVQELKDEIFTHYNNPITKEKMDDDNILLLINIRLTRDELSDPESKKIIGFIISGISFFDLGIKLGVLFKSPDDGQYYLDHIINGSIKTEDLSWQKIGILPVEVLSSVSKEIVRVSSGLKDQCSDFIGVIAGVGSLGSTLAEIWSKEGWGDWIFIDNDYIKPHNIIRHIAKDCDIGFEKVKVVYQHTSLNYNIFDPKKGVFAKVNNLDIDQQSSIFDESSILVDATTTLDAPRDLSVINECPRSVSVFITPTGLSSVLLLEDESRSIRLLSLESQYYRAILTHDWGKEHLMKNSGQIQTGTSCRDFSFTMPQDLISIHASILARQIRLKLEKEESQICIWDYDDLAGGLKSYNIEVHSPNIFNKQGWTIINDHYIETKSVYLRRCALPKETGGIIVGFIDHKIKTINIVDILKAPKDSIENSNYFERGVLGVREELEEISNRTASIVSYIGEWHSHPPNCSSQPSNLDRDLLDYLSQNLSEEGKPALMMIIAEEGYSISIKESV